MAKIEVNYQEIFSTASAVESYCDLQRQKMRSMDSAVKSLVASGWSGADAAAFLQKWEGVDDPSSVAGRFQKALEQFAQSLSACANAYKDAQIEVYNAACALGIFWW